VERKPSTPARTFALNHDSLELLDEPVIDLVADNALLRAALLGAEQAGARSDIITAELQHRIGNLLAVVQAMARQTFRHSDPVRLAAFGARMNALGMAQAILIESETRGATLAEVVTSALAPHGADGAIGDRIKVAGPETTLEGRRAHALTLALHELATNAAKYGALSVERGSVEIEWRSEDGQLDFVWRERDGPACVSPERTGFGSFLITRNLGIAFGGAVDLDFNTAGLICRLRAPAL
jgi:two-component sensor histidine kinase